MRSRRDLRSRLLVYPPVEIEHAAGFVVAVVTLRIIWQMSLPNFRKVTRTSMMCGQ